VLMWGDENDPVLKTFVSAFIRALAGLGWTDGRNLRMDFRWAGGDINRIRAFAQELVGLLPDIIVASSTPVAAALQRKTRTIPIVFVNVSDPSLAPSPRGSTTRVGTSPASPFGKPRWEASGLNCSRRSRPGSNGPQSYSIPTPPPRRLICPHLRRRPGHSRSCQPLRPSMATWTLKRSSSPLGASREAALSSRRTHSRSCIARRSYRQRPETTSRRSIGDLTLPKTAV
jgi:ABC transporter substrate binding protein